MNLYKNNLVIKTNLYFLHNNLRYIISQNAERKQKTLQFTELKPLTKQIFTMNIIYLKIK